MPLVLRAKNPGMRHAVALTVSWEPWARAAPAAKLDIAVACCASTAPEHQAPVDSAADSAETAAQKGSCSAAAAHHWCGNEGWHQQVTRRSLATARRALAPGVASTSTTECTDLKWVNRKTGAHSYYPSRQSHRSWRGGTAHPQGAVKAEDTSEQHCHSCAASWSSASKFNTVPGGDLMAGVLGGSQPEAAALVSDADETLSVSKALTLQGAQQVLAILRGKKLIENRSWSIPRGWYALHAGAQRISEERAERVRAAWPEAPAEEGLPHGAILGLCFVLEQRAPQELRPGYVWARGPICHVISKAVELQRPIPCSGARGLWALSEHQRRSIREQLREAPVAHFDLTPVL